VVASPDGAFARQLADVLRAAGFDAELTTDVTGVELAACAKNAAALAAAAAARAGANVAGAAAGKVFEEVADYARRRGGRPETFAGLAGTGDLVATVLCDGSRNRRAGELVGAGVPAAEVAAVDALAGLIAGDIAPQHWCESLVAPRRVA
jgi:glycerol-3-phosphate dehydrogenase